MYYSILFIVGTIPFVRIYFYLKLEANRTSNRCNDITGPDLVTNWTTDGHSSENTPPIARLPTGVLCSIFHFCLPRRRWGPTAEHLSNPLAFIGVCKAWREAAMSDLSLWAEPFLDPRCQTFGEVSLKRVLEGTPETPQIGRAHV